MNLAWMQPGPFELIIILFVILLLFGGKKLPGLSRALGKSLSEFKKGREDGERAIDEAVKEPEKLKDNEKDQDDDSDK